MHEAGHGHVAVLAARIGHLERRDEGFLQLRDDLPPDGAIRVVALDEIEKMRRDRQRKLAARDLHARAFARSQDEMLLKLFEPGDAVSLAATSSRSIARPARRASSRERRKRRRWCRLEPGWEEEKRRWKTRRPRDARRELIDSLSGY